MKNFKRILSLVLCALMLVSLAACGSKEKEQEVETPEFVYVSSYKPLSTGSDAYFNPRAFNDEGFYSTVYEKVGENIPEGVVPEWEGQYDVYEYRIYFVDNNGQRQRLEAYKPMAPKENTEGYNNFSSGSDLSCLHLNGDGNLVVVETRYSNWVEGELDPNDPAYWDSYKYEQEFFIRVLNPDGSEISSSLIPTNEGEYVQAYNSVLDENGNLVMGQDQGGLKAIATDGSTAYTIESENWVDSMVKLPDGRLAATSWGEKGMELLPIDIQSGSFGEPIAVPNTAYYFYTGGGEYDFYYTSGINFYGYDLETQQSTELFNSVALRVLPA